MSDDDDRVLTREEILWLLDEQKQKIALQQAEIARLQTYGITLEDGIKHAALCLANNQDNRAARAAEVSEEKSQCIYCGEILSGEDAADFDHWKTCARHPARVEVARLQGWEKQIVTLTLQLTEYERLLGEVLAKAESRENLIVDPSRLTPEWIMATRRVVKGEI